MKNYTFASIIPLIGGMSLGGERVLGRPPEWIASWEQSFGANDKYCLEYYNQVPYYELSKTSLAACKYVDIITILPPCAGLSMGNLSKSGSNPRGCSAPSNEHMIKSTLEAMRDLKPKAIIVENAPALFTKSGSQFAERLQVQADQYGYSMSLIKTSSIKHGIPQDRPRSFFVLWKGNKVAVLNEINKPRPAFHELMRNRFPITNSVTKKTNPDNDPLFKFIQEKTGLNKQDLLMKYASERMVSTWNIIYSEGWLEEAYHTFKDTNPRLGKWLLHTINKKTAGLNILDGSMKLAWEKTRSLMWQNLEFIPHPFENRYLMTSEALALMGFPESFYKTINIETKNSNVICQNVPACTAADWISEVVAALDGERDWVTTAANEILKQDNCSSKAPMKPIIYSL